MFLCVAKCHQSCRCIAELMPSHGACEECREVGACADCHAYKFSTFHAAPVQLDVEVEALRARVAQSEAELRHVAEAMSGRADSGVSDAAVDLRKAFAEGFRQVGWLSPEEASAVRREHDKWLALYTNSSGVVAERQLREKAEAERDEAQLGLKDCYHDLKSALKGGAAYLDRAEKAEAELRHVASVVARRPALSESTLAANVEKAISVAAKADELERERDEARGRADDAELNAYGRWTRDALVVEQRTRAERAEAACAEMREALESRPYVHVSQVAAMRDFATVWLRKAYDALGREGYEDGDAAEEVRSALNDVLSNLGSDPCNTPAAPLAATMSSHPSDDAGRAYWERMERYEKALRVIADGDDNDDVGTARAALAELEDKGDE